MQDNKHFCDACGTETVARYRIGSYMFCRSCTSASCRETALKIADIKHKAALETTLEKLESNK